MLDFFGWKRRAGRGINLAIDEEGRNSHRGCNIIMCIVVVIGSNGDAT